MTMTFCSEPGCEKSVLARGLCSTHYSRMRAAEGKEKPPAPKPETPSNGIAREMYLIARDAAAELGVTPPALQAMTKALNCGHPVRPRLRAYTAKDIATLRALHGWMTELDVSAAVAVRLMRKVAQLRKAGAALPGEQP